MVLKCQETILPPRGIRPIERCERHLPEGKNKSNPSARMTKFLQAHGTRHPAFSQEPGTLLNATFEPDDSPLWLYRKRRSVA